MDISKIKILGHEYTVTQKENFIAETGGNTGQCNNYTNTITIAQEISESGKREVLTHEIIEALNYRLELNLEHHKICALGEALNQVLSDNCELRK